MSSMTLRLDTAGLRSLIQDNPEFEIEIQQAVMNNIKADQIDNAIQAKLTSALNGMCTREGWSGKVTITDPKFLDAIRIVVEDKVKEISDKVIKGAVQDLLTHERFRVQRELGATVKEAMLLTITPEMAKEILLAKLI